MSLSTEKTDWLVMKSGEEMKSVDVISIFWKA
jgi:hypothetical protein